MNLMMYDSVRVYIFGLGTGQLESRTNGRATTKPIGFYPQATLSRIMRQLLCNVTCVMCDVRCDFIVEDFNMKENM